MTKKRTVFFISDRTGITAEALGHSLLTQFEGLAFRHFAYPFIDTLEKAKQLIEKIEKAYLVDQAKPLLFTSIVNPDIRQLFMKSHGMLIDLFNTFIGPLEAELQVSSSYTVGRSHSMDNYETYKLRIDAVNYALSNDDGVGAQNYHEADIILLGVSRCGKTPTCLYLALQFGVYAANYPITEEDMGKLKLPASLCNHHEKLFGLTIEPERLHSIRTERRANSPYAAMRQCHYEVQEAEALFRKANIDYLNTTTRSIEEIATTILAKRGIKRQMF